MPDQLGTLIALATYNERDSLPSLVEAILRVVPDADLLVVDDNSPDGTGRWCDQRAREEPRLSCLHRTAKLGLGTATLAAMRYAIQRGYAVLVTLDADGSHDPAHLPQLIAGTQHVDVMIGSRYADGGRIQGWPFVRRIISRGLNAISCRLLRLPVRDASGAYRAYRVSKLAHLPLDEVQASGYAYLEELLWMLRRHAGTFDELPILFRDRQRGRSKADWREAWGKIRMLARLVLKPGR